MAAPVGAVVSIYYDSPTILEPGDHLVTPTGRTYRVEDNRVQTRGAGAGRQHLTCTVLEPGTPPEDGARVAHLHWYRRG